MPWKESSVMDERIRFVIRLQDGESMASLCREFGISRKSLLRERPALEAIYCFKQRLCYLLLEKSCNQSRCQKLAHRFRRDIAALRGCGFAPLVALGPSLHAWRKEIATMWRFTRNRAITEGFHNKMEVLSRQAYGFRDFQNYRLRVSTTVL